MLSGSVILRGLPNGPKARGAVRQHVFGSIRLHRLRCFCCKGTYHLLNFQSSIVCQGRELTEMSRFKTFAAVVLVGGALFVAAAFAQSIGRWTTGSPMPSARTEIAVAEVGGKIYVVGGFRGERELEIYDPSTDHWSRRASLPRSLHHAGAVGLNGKLYVGGFVEGWTPTDEVHEYDPASDRWQRLAALPTARGALAAAVLDGKIYAVGGIGWRGRNTAAHEVYDPAANRWTALSYVPTARDHLAVAALDGRLYAVGGRIGGNYSRDANLI
jgi:N-acetylneuraminic acid mutarotase